LTSFDRWNCEKGGSSVSISPEMAIVRVSSAATGKAAVYDHNGSAHKHQSKSAEGFGGQPTSE